MINYLPPIYPDELAYSWFCRLFVHSGYLTHSDALKDLLSKRSDNPSKEFLGHLNPDAQKKIQEIIPIKKLILENTMFPQYTRFIPLEDKKKALYRLEYDYCDAHHLFSILPRSKTDKQLKYCPMCVKEDRNKYGETYWHRVHQIRNMQICPIHNCYLISSNVAAKSEQTFTFCPAEYHVQSSDFRAINNELITLYNKYLFDVFNAEIDLDNECYVSALLYYGLNKTKYISSNGKMKNTQLLANDLQVFYSDMGIDDIVTYNQLNRIWNKECFDFTSICQIAFYLGITLEELTTHTLTKEQIHKEEKSHYMKDKAPINWNELDNELAPKLEEYAKKIYNGTTDKRPERVSERLIYREFKLSAHSLENLPQCQAILDEYSETYEQNWARRIVWAYDKLKLERRDKPIYWSDIRKLSGVKKDKIPHCKEYLNKKIFDRLC